MFVVSQLNRELEKAGRTLIRYNLNVTEDS